MIIITSTITYNRSLPKGLIVTLSLSYHYPPCSIFTMASFGKLPRDVQRELLRHVKPLPNSKANSKATTGGMNQNHKTTTMQQRKQRDAYKILLACVGFVGFSASLPYWATQWIDNLNDRDDPLTPAQVRRGAFLNSGSKDAGKDPNWDWKHGRYVYPPGFAEHLKQQNPNQTDFGPDLGPMVQEERRRQQQQ